MRCQDSSDASFPQILEVPNFFRVIWKLENNKIKLELLMPQCSQIRYTKEGTSTALSFYS